MSFIAPPVTGYIGTVQRVSGYRPIEVTLVFRDGSQAVPDSIGSPRLGAAYYIGPEILLETEKKATVTSLGISTKQVGQQITGQSQSVVNYKVYKTAQSPILWGPGGVSIRCFWHNPTEAIPSVNDIPIQPDKVIVDTKQGIVEVNEASPKDHSQVIAYYYSTITETTPRIVQSTWETLSSSTEAGLVGYSTVAGLSQVYPVTRNITNYVTSDIVEFKVPNLDRTSPDYYPVFEYRIKSGGVVEFSVPLHSQSSQPARVIVKYKSLALNPRILVDMVQSTDIVKLEPISLNVLVVN